MVVQVNEHVDAILSSIQVVKKVFLPLDVSIRKVTKDFEQNWPGYRNWIGSHGKIIDDGSGIELMQLDAGGHGSGNGYVSSDERNKGVTREFEGKVFGSVLPDKNPNHGHRSDDGNHLNDHRVGKLRRKGLKEKYGSGKENGPNPNCLQFGVVWSLFINGFVKGFPSPFKDGKKRVQKASDGNDFSSSPSTCQFRWKGIKGEAMQGLSDDGMKFKEVNDLSFEYMLAFFIDQLSQGLPMFEANINGSLCKSSHSSPAESTFDHWKVLTSILEGKSANVHGFLRNLRFARVGGVPVGVVGDTSIKEISNDGVKTSIIEESERTFPLKFSSGLLSIPFSNVERLRSSLSTVSFTELIELLPQLGRPSRDYPDKKKLFSVQDFFKYTETEGRRFFEELDRDGDGEVTLEDLEVVMRKRKLPRRYAREFMHRARRHLFSKSFGWKQFQSLMEQKEPTILRAYTSLCLSKSGTLQKSEILASLESAGLPANEDNAVAMMRFLNADSGESISYGHFRNFMLMLPSDRLQEDPRSIWFEAATVVAVPPPVEITTGSFLKSALAGGLACALSTALMHPVDTIKTQVQASTLSFPEIISKVPQLGARGLYRGSIPAIFGQFSSHGLRTGIFEASKLVLINVVPTLQELQVQSLASFCGTFVGTAVRIPCEVLKQRLQAGLFTNVGEAVVGTWQQDGMSGFFRGTGATLFREVPFYVAGMGLYAESKKVVQKVLGRELEPWEIITVGALSGGLTAVLTTPFDVIKTRMMTAPKGRQLSLMLVAVSILRREGPLGLFKGAVPRFFWIAPLGAMNFAGYELAKKAMDKNEETVEQAPQKSFK